jgi:hypothetical protein
LVGKSKVTVLSEDLGVDWRIILKRIVKSVQTGWIWVQTGTSGSLKAVYVSSDSKKGYKMFD